MNNQCVGTDEDVCGDTVWDFCIECEKGYCEKHISEDSICVNCQEKEKK